MRIRPSAIQLCSARMTLGTDTLSISGNIASLLGLVVSVAGFAWTLVAVRNAKRVAEGAKAAAEKARADILEANSMVELASAVTAMEEIKRLHRQGAWPLLPDRYASLREALATIRTMRPTMSDEHQSVFQGAIQQLRDIEDKVERALATQQQPRNVPALNKVISLQIDKLAEVLAVMRVGDNG
jgi:hypothetical protein